MNDLEEAGQVTAALRKYHHARDRADELSKIIRGLSEETRDLKREIDRLTRDLHDRRNLTGFYSSFRRRNRRQEAEVEARLKRAQSDYQRKLGRLEQVKTEHQELRRLVDRSHEFLTAGGASIVELEAGIALPQGVRRA